MTDITLEKLKIAEGLAEVKTTVDVLIAETKIRNENYAKNLEVMEENIKLLNIVINGEGDKKGLNERTRVLEFYDSNRRKHYAAFYLAIIAGAGAWVWKAIENHFK